MENKMELPWKPKTKTTKRCSESTCDYSEKNENTSLKRYMQPKVHSSIISNNQDMEATQVSTNRQMDKEDVYVYMYAYEGERGE